MMLTETLLFVIHYLLVIMTVFLASPADVAKLQQNEIKNKKDQTCVFLGNHQATQKKSFRKGLSLTWKEPEKWVIFCFKRKAAFLVNDSFSSFGSWTHFTVCLPRQVLISLHNFYDWAIFGRCCNILALQYTTLPWLALPGCCLFRASCCCCCWPFTLS